MSARQRNANRIRGPQSALTDFLAANNISAAQIRDTYNQRVNAQQPPSAPPAADGAQPATDGEVATAQAEVAPPEPVNRANPKKRKRNDGKSKATSKAAAKKNAKKSKKGQDSDGSGSDIEDDAFANMNMYKKAKPMPGQLENCDICSKRFTVTPYSKSGPDGGLVCSPCGKELAADEKLSGKKTKKAAPKTRRKAESNKLDGLVSTGSKTLQQLCIEKVADHHHEVEEFGDLPDKIVDRLAEIFAKRRVLKPRTLPLFLRPDLDIVAIHDAAYLEVDDYKQIFAVAPNITKLILRNACQFKDAVLSYILEKAPNITHFHVYAANLVSDEMWCTFFQEYGHKLESLKLEWLDSTFDDDVVTAMVEHCPNLRHLKLKFCRRITSASLLTIAQLKQLEHLSLKLSHPTETIELTPLISSLGSNLRTLSLENCTEADDTVIDEIRNSCSKLRKFRLTHIDCVTDASFASLFNGKDETPSVVPPLSYVDLSSARDVDNSNPEGPQDNPIGLASDGFKALMAHSGSNLKRLEIASCRHISHAAFCDVFNGETSYPLLEEINVSFCNAVDTAVIKGIFRCCPNLKKLCAFGCFKIEDLAVPRGIALIGVPRAHETIEQFGEAFVDTESAMKMMDSFMVDVAA